MIKRIFKIILKIVLVCFLVFVVLVFALDGYYIFYKQRENKKTNKIDWPDHVYLTPRTKDEIDENEEKTQLTREQILRGEYTEKDNVTMDDIKVVVLDKNTGEIDRHLGERPGHKLNSWQSGKETEIWGSYIATLEDVKSWPIGPHGWQEPPEDFKIRTRAYGKEGVELNDYTKNLFEKVRSAWTVNVEINGKLYALQGGDIEGDHRRSILTTDKNGDPDMELLIVDSKNKTDWLHLLALAIGNDKIVEGIAGGMPIKNNVN